MISVPVSIGIAVDLVGEGRGAHLVVALFELAHHHLDRDDRVVDQQAERDDQRAERDLVQADARSSTSTTKVIASTSGIVIATTKPGRRSRVRSGFSVQAEG